MFIQEDVQFGILKFDLAARKFFVNEVFVPLRNKEFSLIYYFLKNAGKVLTRTQILEEVWDQNVFCSTNTVDVHISALRRKVKLYCARDLIKTIHCVGYLCELCP